MNSDVAFVTFVQSVCTVRFKVELDTQRRTDGQRDYVTNQHVFLLKKDSRLNRFCAPFCR